MPVDPEAVRVVGTAVAVGIAAVVAANSSKVGQAAEKEPKEGKRK